MHYFSPYFVIASGAQPVSEANALAVAKQSPDDLEIASSLRSSQ